LRAASPAAQLDQQLGAITGTRFCGCIGHAQGSTLG
jgi:hypothetical protein